MCVQRGAATVDDADAGSGETVAIQYEQPWRFVVYDNRIHIFSKKHSVEKLRKWDEVNFGIMFANMMVAAEELWLDVDLIRLGDISQKNFSNNQYVLSAILKA